MIKKKRLKIRVIVIKPIEQLAYVDVIDNDLKTFDEIIGCRMTDVTHRYIGNGSAKRIPVEIIGDDEGLYKETPAISAIDNTGKPQLVGNLIITGVVDEDGEFTDCKNADRLLKYCQVLFDRRYPKGLMMLTQCERYSK